MTDNIAKITKVVLWVLIALSLFFALMLFTNASEEDVTWISNALTFTQVILYITAGITVLFSLYLFTMIMIEKPRKSLVKLIPFVLLAVVFIVAISMASDVPLDMPNYEGDANTPVQNKWSGAGLIMMYIILGLAILSIIYVSIARLFK
jgi:amino acid transporter